MLSILLSTPNRIVFFLFLYFFAANLAANAQNLEEKSSSNNDLSSYLLQVKSKLSNSAMPIDVRQANFVFKMDYKADQKASFTAEDAQELRKFLNYGEQLISCDAKELSVISKQNEDNEYQFVSVTDELKVAGYQVNDLVCEEGDVTFAITKIKYIEDCEDCKQIEISKTLLDKFKDVDYGGELIDFSMEGMGGDGGESTFEVPVSNDIQESWEELKEVETSTTPTTSPSSQPKPQP